MPESVRDRPTRSHEYIFLLSKADKYYYDIDAIREPLSSSYTKDVRFRSRYLRKDLRVIILVRRADIREATPQKLELSVLLSLLKREEQALRMECEPQTIQRRALRCIPT